MAFGVLFRSNLAFAISAVNKIGRSSIRAAAEVIRKEAENNAKRGMRSGKFVTEELANNIFIHIENNDVAYIGTPIKHGKYWEEGHINLVIDPSGGTWVRERWLSKAFTSTTAKQHKKAKEEAETTAKRFAGLAAGRLLGLTPIGPLQSTIG